MFILNTQVDGCEYRDIYNLHSSGLKHPIYMQSTAQLHIFGWIYVLSCHDDRFIVSEQIVQNIDDADKIETVHKIGEKKALVKC